MAGREAGGGPGTFVGPWYAHWPGDPLPALPPLPGLVVAPAADDRALAALAAIDPSEVSRRRAAGNRPYLACLDGAAVACGWSTAATVAIGELGLVFALPPGNRYLWGFVTAAPWRGRGFYPQLLQAILRRECADGATRAWIGHEPHNAASARGLLKAGFRSVGDVFRTPAGAFVLVPVGPLARARAGAALLGAAMHEPGGPT